MAEVKERSARIAALNDAFRKEPTRHGRAVVTRGVNDLGPDFAFLATRAVAAFNAFTADNDPYGEHDFGSFELGGLKRFWKIDCVGFGTSEVQLPNVLHVRRLLSSIL